MKKKIFSLLMAGVLSLSIFVGCGEEKKNSTSQVEQKQEVDKNQEDAENLLKELKGSYQELWPVLLADEYKQKWVDNSGEIVGKENADAAVEKLESMVTGEVYGEEAVKAYENGENSAYFCGFTQEVAKITILDNMVIKGYDKDGNELFSHTYHYVGMEEVRGLYEYESDDKNSGEFTYFCFAADTSETTYHIEFRYGSDLKFLGKYDNGKYAYWLASGISTEYDEKMIDNCIKLFCTENLSE